MNKKYSVLLVVLISLFALQSARAVELLYTLAEKDNPAVGDGFAGMQFDDQGNLHVLNQKSGLLIRYKDTQASTLIESKALGFNDFSQIDDQTFAFINTSKATVVLLNLKGEEISVFGEKGSKAGMLKKPVGLAFSLNKRLYIADKSENHISAYNRNGVFLYALGQSSNRSSDNAHANLKQPEQVFVDAQERVYVLKTGTAPVLSIYETSGYLIKAFSTADLKSTINKRLSLSSMAVDAAGRVFLANSATGKIIQFAWEAGKVERSFGSKGEGPGQYENVIKMAVAAPNKIAVADSRNKKIDIYKLHDLEAVKPVRVWLPNVGEVSFKALDCSNAYRLPDLNILCLNKKANTVQMLSDNGKQLKSLNAKFKNPVQAAFDEEHIVILNKSSIMVFSSTGNLLAEFGKSGSADGNLRAAEDIFLHGNRIYVADTGNKRIQIFSIKGVYLDKIPAKYDKSKPLLQKPISVAVDANENIYIADESKKRVLAFSSDKKPRYEIGDESDLSSSFKAITDLGLDTDNNLYVLCATGLKEQTVQVYSGPDKVFEFGAFSKKIATGIGKGVSISVSPTRKTLVSLFDIGDAKNHGLITFDYLQIPAPVSEVHVIGGIEATQLQWRSPPGSYINSFNVYGANDTESTFVLLQSTEEIQAQINHQKQGAHRFYKVTAVSGFGTEGPASIVRENNFKLAHQAYELQQYSESIKILQQSIEDHQAQPESLRLLGLNLMQQEKYAAAAEQFRILSAFEGYEVEGLNLQIETLYLNKDYGEAVVLVQKALVQANGEIASYINCGRLSLKIGDAIGAVNCLEEGLKKDPEHTELNYMLAEAYLDVGATERGLQQLEKSIKLAPAEPSALIRSAEIYVTLGDSEKAVAQYEKALQIDQSNSRGQLGLAQSYVQLKKPGKAKNIALKLAGQTETAGSGNFLLGLIALGEKNNGEALLALSKATRADPENIDAWLALADTYERMANTEKMIESLQAAVNADPTALPALKRLGFALNESGRYAEAANALLEAIKLRDDDYALLYAAANSLFENRQFNIAAEYSRKMIELSQQDIKGLKLAAGIAKQRGQTGEAIEYLKSAINLQKENYELHVELGELYLDYNLYDQAEAVLDKATIINKSNNKAHMLLGNLHLKRRLYDRAIAAYEKGVKLNSNAENRLLLDTAYAQKKRSLEFTNNAPQVLLEDLRLNPVFSAAYKLYAEKPLGSIKVQNISDIDYGNLKVTFEIKGYMDFPSQQNIEKLTANSTQEIPLLAAFNNKILEIDEDTGVQVEVKLTYIREGQPDSVNVTQAMTLYGKNAIVWNEPNMVGSFVTPKDDTLRDFVRRTMNAFKPEAGPLNENLVSAMTLFNALSAYGVRYEVDPSNPFSGLKSDQVDYVQYGRETLKLKSGDCDDLSVLLSAALENLGVETAVLDVPGHLLMMFNTNLSPNERDLISAHDGLLVIHNDKVWVPLEATLVAVSFAEAWAEGARKYHENEKNGTLKTIVLKEAWQQYQPVTLRPANYTLELPTAERLTASIQRERHILLEKGLDRLVKPFRAMIKSNPKDALAYMQVAIVYAKYGLYDEAFAELDRIQQSNPNNSAVYNNRGNIYYGKGDFVRAKESYDQAERLDPSDGGIKLNLALLAYQVSDITLARRKLQQAVKLNKPLQSQYQTFGKLLEN